MPYNLAKSSDGLCCNLMLQPEMKLYEPINGNEREGVVPKQLTLIG